MSASRPPYDLLVVGSGYAGLSAALFGGPAGAYGGHMRSRGRAGLQLRADRTLWACTPSKRAGAGRTPWAGIETLIADRPEHPYARVPRPRIQEALLELGGFLSAQGLPLYGL